MKTGVSLCPMCRMDDKEGGLVTTSQIVQGPSLPGTKLLRLLTAHHHHQIKIGTKIQHQLSPLKHLLGIRRAAFKLSQAHCLQIKALFVLQ